jgi:uncharacterized protein YdaU (DUF1376 family)
MNYYSHHIGDHLVETAHISIIEEGVYRRLLDLYYSTEKPLPNDLRILSRKIRITKEDEIAALELVLNEFFAASEAGWVNGKCDSEISMYQSKSEKNKENGSKGGRPVKKNNPDVTQNNPDVTQVVSDENPEITLTNNQEPITNNHLKDIAPSAAASPDKFSATQFLLNQGVDKRFVDDWLKVRKAKKAAPTETAMEKIAHEVRKSGLTWNDAIRTCCEQSWAGFNASWPRDSPHGKGGGGSDMPDWVTQ